MNNDWDILCNFNRCLVNNGDGTFSLRTSGGGGSGTTITRSVTQSSHGFSVGDVLYLNGSTYTKAKADAVATAEVVGIVSAVANSNTFSLSSLGYITGLSGLTAGTVYFLSASTAGALTATEPTTSGHVSKPLLIADSTTSGYFFNMRGVVISTAGLTGTFTNGTLSSGVLTITHNWGLSAPYSVGVFIFDNNNQEIIPDNLTGAANSVAIDLTSYGTLSGTWGYIVIRR